MRDAWTLIHRENSMSRKTLLETVTLSQKRQIPSGILHAFSSKLCYHIINYLFRLIDLINLLFHPFNGSFTSA